MIKLKVGDKFVIKNNVLTLKEIAGDGRIKVLENDFILHVDDHIDWEATKKLHEVGKTYEWHEAIKMAAEGTPMCVAGCNDRMELIGEHLMWVSNYSDICSEVLVVRKSNTWSNKWIPYIKPITLTDDEKTILRNVDVECNFIARDKDCSLWLYNSIPTKSELFWELNSGEYYRLRMYEHLFQQIKWEDKEPCLIADLIKG